MRVLLWHGYLLRGSGSNIYTANVAKALRSLDHDVVLMCQERAVEALGFVDEEGDVDAGGVHRLRSIPAVSAGHGTCRLLRPLIGRILPVYVWDEYEGFEAKRFVDLSSEELDRYVDANVAALSAVVDSFDPEIVLVGHEVMGPFIAHSSRLPRGYSVKLHGSALEYAVRVQERFRSFASTGLCGAKSVIGGSRYMIAAAASVVGGWEERAAVVNPGCDIEIFGPTPEREPHPTVGYVGKLIAAKGVHLLLAALGLTRTQGLRCIVIGYGGMEARLHQLAAALRSGDVSAIRRVAAEGEGGPLVDLLRWIDDGGLTTEVRARLSEVPVEFAGRIDHDRLGDHLGRLWALAVPSVVPEAFGMVAAEAAASGVLPLVPDHSGIGEAGAAIESAIGVPGFLRYDPRRPIEGLAARIDGVADLHPRERRRMEAKAIEHARQSWAWGVVAERLLEVAR